ncbi:MAG: AMP-binding protein, partial [bacterium]|nr:AMP-binding protein [bacterium]
NEISKRFFFPFDLAKAPLLRVGVIETTHTSGREGGASDDTGQRLMLLDMHHIITDGVSQGVLAKEFFAMQGGESLPPLTLRYGDYAEWQNSTEQKELMKQQQEFWLKTFTGELPILNLPTDYTRPAMQNFDGNTISFKINQEETANLKETAKQNETTLYMIILSTFTLLLSKLSGQEDIIVGVPTAGRRRAELANIIGMFVNTLVMRNYPEGGKTVGEFLREVKEKTLNAFENQEYQFEDLVDKLSVRRDTGRNPIFDVMFSHMDNTLSGIDIPEEPEKTGVRHHYEKTTINSKFDLTLDLQLAGGKLVFTFEYCVKLFKKETIQRFSGYLKKIITGILSNPETKIMEIDMLSEEEKKHLVIDFNNTAADYPEDKTIHRLFEEQAVKIPDSIAAIHNFLQLTYRELNERSQHLATLLQAKGFNPGDIAGLAVPPSVETVIAILAIWKAGGSYLPVELALPMERIKYMLTDSSARILLKGNRESAGMDQEKKLSELTDGIEVVSIDRLPPAAEHPVAPRGPSGGQKGDVAPPGTTIALRAAYVIYTSGTTGKPKGVLVPHSAFVNRMWWLKKRYGFDTGDVFIQKTPLTFDVSVCELFRWIPGGGRVLLMKPGGEKDPELMLKTIERHRATTIDFVPSMLTLFLDYTENTKEPAAVTTLKWIFVGVEPLNPELVKKFNRSIYKR